MRAVVQRAARASVDVDGERIASIGRGLLVFVGVEAGDGPEDIDYIVRKCTTLRIFEDEEGHMNDSVQDLGLEILVVSQFTLLGDVRRGRRPSFTKAGPVDKAEETFRAVTEAFRKAHPRVFFGQFQAHMEVGLVNDGPVTILLDSRKEF